MAIAIRDLRSAVCREATITIAKLAEVLGDRFEPFIDSFMPELLKQVVINVKVIADSANLGIRYMIRSMRSKSMVARLMETAEAKAVALRKRVADYVLLLLEVC